MSGPVDAARGLVESARAGAAPPVALVRGDRALAEPLALRLAAEIGAAWGVEPQRLNHPAQLPDLVADLRTLALFEPGKIAVAVETGLLADKSAAAALLAPVLKAKPFTGGPDDLEGDARDAALRLLQVVRLHDLDPHGDPERVLAGLPASLFTAARKGASAEATRRELAPLLAAAMAAGLRGTGSQDLSLVADLVRDGLPERHLLLLVESAVAERHPVVETLARRHAVVDAGQLEMKSKGGFAGLEALVAGLERETGVRIRRDAVEELARRTLRGVETRPGEEGGGVDSASAARFGAELRKLATLAPAGVIERAAVEEHVEDRGQEEVWPILDALGEGDAAGALEKVLRRLRGADDPIRERLSLFSLLAAFARQLVAVRGLLEATGARGGESSFQRFKDRVAPVLQGEIEGLAVNPVAKLHPYRLHRVYLAASRFPAAAAAGLAARTLETERRLKGDSADPEAALAAYLVALSGRSATPGSGSRAGSRARGGGGGRS